MDLVNFATEWPNGQSFRKTRPGNSFRAWMQRANAQNAHLYTIGGRNAHSRHPKRSQECALRNALSGLCRDVTPPHGGSIPLYKDSHWRICRAASALWGTELSIT